MGGCFSSHSQSSDDRSISRHHKPSANVVSASGELRQYPIPVTASEILKSQQTTSPSSPIDDSFFLCCSDRLYFDDYIPPLNPDDDLEPAQIYFVLPKSRLQYRLAAVDLAALAVKASLALDQINASNNRRKRKTRISPVSASDDDNQDRQSNQTVSFRSPMMIGNNNNNINNNNKSSPAGLGVTRSGSVRRLTRYSSRRAKLAVESFRNKLSTIYEGTQTFK